MALIESCGRLLGAGLATPAGLMSQVFVRFKPGKGRRWGVGPTKNHMHKTNAKERGLKVYDGQRVPTDKTLVAQFWPRVFPGWNVKYSGRFYDLQASVNGRAMVTTERLEPNWEQKQVKEVFKSHHQQESQLFKHFVHVIPDKQHQYFKLVEEI